MIKETRNPEQGRVASENTLLSGVWPLVAEKQALPTVILGLWWLDGPASWADARRSASSADASNSDLVIRSSRGFVVLTGGTLLPSFASL